MMYQEDDGQCMKIMVQALKIYKEITKQIEEHLNSTDHIYHQIIEIFHKHFSQKYESKVQTHFEEEISPSLENDIIEYQEDAEELLEGA